MADTLEIFGVEYTNVAGIIATNNNDTDLTYIRPQGTKSITANGTGIDVAEYASVNVSVPSGTPSLQTKTKTYTPTESQQTETVTADSGYDGLDEVDITVNAVSSTYVGSGITRRSSTDLTASGATVTVPSGYYASNASKAVPTASFFTNYEEEFVTENNVRKWRVRGITELDTGEGDTEGYISEGIYNGEWDDYAVIASGTSITPTESAQTIGDTKTMLEDVVTVNAIPSNYVGSSITRRDSTDLTASGATVSVPSGYYSAQASKSVASGTAGTPTATKGTVSNHQVSVTPSVTNTAGYISGGTINGTAVTVTASELVSGSDTVTTNDTYDVTNLAELVVAVSGGGGVTVTDVANTTGTTCVITTGSAPSEDIPLNTELIKYGDVVSGYIIDSSTGDETVSQWSSCSDFTLIDPTMTFSYIGYQWYYLAFYDTSKNYISSIYMTYDADSVTNDYAHGTLTPSKIPSTAKYVRISSYPTNPSSTQLSLIRTA